MALHSLELYMLNWQQWLTSKISLGLYIKRLSIQITAIFKGGTTAEGIHAGVMAATLYIPLTAFAGIDFREDVMRIDPNLPKQWQNIQFNIQVRGINYHFNVTHETLTVVADQKYNDHSFWCYS